MSGTLYGACTSLASLREPGWNGPAGGGGSLMLAKVASAADAPATPAPRVEIRALTGLRIVAAVWVMLFHLQGGLMPFGPYLGILWPVIRAGWLGVDLFFVLSGFVMTLTYLEKLGPRFRLRPTGSFMWARLCRIWPLWALLTVLYGGWLTWSAFDASAAASQRRVVTPLSLLEQLSMTQMW